MLQIGEIAVVNRPFTSAKNGDLLQRQIDPTKEHVHDSYVTLLYVLFGHFWNISLRILKLVSLCPVHRTTELV